MKTIILLAVLLSGCANITKEKFGDIFLAVLAARLSQPGYDYRQGMRDSQNYINNAMYLHKQQEAIMFQPKFENIICNKYGNTINCHRQMY